MKKIGNGQQVFGDVKKKSKYVLKPRADQSVRILFTQFKKKRLKNYFMHTICFTFVNKKI